MPSHDSCCAYGCSNWRGKKGCEGIRFYRIPKDEETRWTWIARINRQDLRLEDVTDNTHLRSAHFVDGQKTPAQPLPVIFKHRSYHLCRKSRAPYHPALVLAQTTSACGRTQGLEPGSSADAVKRPAASTVTVAEPAPKKSTTAVADDCEEDQAAAAEYESNIGFERSRLGGRDLWQKVPSSPVTRNRLTRRFVRYASDFISCKREHRRHENTVIRMNYQLRINTPLADC